MVIDTTLLVAGKLDIRVSAGSILARVNQDDVFVFKIKGLFPYRAQIKIKVVFRLIWVKLVFLELLKATLFQKLHLLFNREILFGLGLDYELLAVVDHCCSEVKRHDL